MATYIFFWNPDISNVTKEIYEERMFNTVLAKVIAPFDVLYSKCHTLRDYDTPPYREPDGAC